MWHEATPNIQQRHDAMRDDVCLPSLPKTNVIWSGILAKNMKNALLESNPSIGAAQASSPPNSPLPHVTELGTDQPHATLP